MIYIKWAKCVIRFTPLEIDHFWIGSRLYVNRRINKSQNNAIALWKRTHAHKPCKKSKVFVFLRIGFHCSLSISLCRTFIMTLADFWFCAISTWEIRFKMNRHFSSISNALRAACNLNRLHIAKRKHHPHDPCPV